MRKSNKTVSVLVCIVLTVALLFATAFNTLAVTNSDINNQQKKANASKSKLDSVRKEITQINTTIANYNAKINSINSKISANKAEIAKQEAEIEKDKLEFKKRIRTIYMSNSDSTVRLLLGADDFSSFLQLAQLTSAVSSRDKEMMEDLAQKIKELNEINDENKKLLEKETAAKKEVEKQQSALRSKESEAEKLYSKDVADLDALRAQKKKEDAEIANRARGGGGAAKTPSFINDSGAFLWPVSGFYTISAGYQSNDSVHKGHHNGIDISGSGISGQPIRAISDGYVSYVYNSCSHNYKKSGSCGCGSGYGNYCIINHGTVSGAEYSAYYAHAARICVSPGQKVSRGQVVGYVGTTGWSTGYHLHLGVLKNGGWTNPSNLTYQK